MGECMKIWVDADACPVVVKDILVRAAQRWQVETIFVANKSVSLPPSPWVNSIIVAAGADVADAEIVARATEGDVAISSDIPLASELISKQVVVMNNRGELFTKDNIRARLQMRDFMDTLRGSGIHTGGPKAYSQADRKSFADQLDRILAKRCTK